MCDVRDERRVSKVLIRRMVLLVRVAIWRYAERRAGESAGTGVALWGVDVWLGGPLPFCRFGVLFNQDPGVEGDVWTIALRAM